MMSFWGVIYTGMAKCLVEPVAKTGMSAFWPLAAHTGAVQLSRNFIRTISPDPQTFQGQFVIYDCNSPADKTADPQTKIPQVIKDLDFILYGASKSTIVLVRHDGPLKDMGFEVPLRYQKQVYLQSEMLSCVLAWLTITLSILFSIFLLWLVSDREATLAKAAAGLFISNILGKSFENHALSSIERQREIAEIQLISTLRPVVEEIVEKLEQYSQEGITPDNVGIRRDTMKNEKHWRDRGDGVLADLKAFCAISGSQNVVQTINDLEKKLEEALGHSQQPSDDDY